MEFYYTWSPEVVNYERSIYTSLDLLGDMGGLFDALCAAGKILLFFISYITKDGPYIYILSRLFKRGRSSSMNMSEG